MHTKMQTASILTDFSAEAAAELQFPWRITTLFPINPFFVRTEIYEKSKKIF